MALNIEIVKERFLSALRPDNSSVLSPEQMQSLEVYATKLADAVIRTIKDGEVKFNPGSVNGICPPGQAGGPLQNGSANNGEIF